MNKLEKKKAEDKTRKTGEPSAFVGFCYGSHMRKKDRKKVLTDLLACLDEMPDLLCSDMDKALSNAFSFSSGYLGNIDIPFSEVYNAVYDWVDNKILSRAVNEVLKDLWRYIDFGKNGRP